nr:MAG TPA: hypothetical protein [Bacteriophage sp.]
MVEIYTKSVDNLMHNNQRTINCAYCVADILNCLII